MIKNIARIVLSPLWIPLLFLIFGVSAFLTTMVWLSVQDTWLDCWKDVGFKI